MSNTLKETTYTSNAADDNAWGLLRSSTRELLQRRSLIATLVHSDIKGKYRQSIFGYVWILLPPLVTMAIFAVLVSHRALPFGDAPVPYPLFALWNLSVWYLFAGILLACTNSLVAAGPLVTKLNFAKGTLVIAAMGQPIFEFFVRLLPVLGLFIWYGVWPGPEALWVPLLLLLVIMMALGLGLILAVLNLFLRDFGSLLAILLTVGVFLSPILYPPAADGLLSVVNWLNPFSPLLIAGQAALFDGPLPSLTAFAASTAIAVVVVISGWWFFNAILPRAVEQA